MFEQYCCPYSVGCQGEKTEKLIFASKFDQSSHTRHCTPLFNWNKQYRFRLLLTTVMLTFTNCQIKMKRLKIMLTNLAVRFGKKNYFYRAIHSPNLKN